MDKSEGLVIRTADYGESNKIVTLLTLEYGKIGLMARGAKKARSKLGSSTQFLTHGEYLFKRGRGLGVLYQGDAYSYFRETKLDIEKTAYAAFVCELVEKSLDEKVPAPSVYSLLLHALKGVEEGKDAEVISFIVQIKMLPLHGIKPGFEGCSRCGSTDGQAFYFSLSNGGILCSECRHLDGQAVQLSRTAVRLLYLFERMDLKRLGDISVKKETKAELKAVIDAFYDSYSGVYLKSKRFLDQLDKYQPYRE